MVFRWAKADFVAFIDWHERVISQYPLAIQMELREYRTHFLHGVVVT